MYLNKTILAVVPARSGSKGIVDKNIRQLDGISLIGRAGLCLNNLDWIDAKVISTDSEAYAKEGEVYGLEAPFIRPSSISCDTATAVDTIVHALLESEKSFGIKFDVVLIIEPTSPFRRSNDIESTLKEMIINNADSSICVSPLNTKYHPLKTLKIDSGKLSHYEQLGEKITARQQLNELYVRNGACYAVLCDYLLKHRSLFSDNTYPYIVNRNMVNIDDPIDFKWAQFLIDNDLLE